MKTLQTAALTAALLLSATASHAIDGAPGDYSWLGAGQSLLISYTQFSTADTFKLDGVGEVPDSKVDTFVQLIRGVHYFELSDQRFAVQFFMPFGKFTTARVGGVDQPTSDGVGDLTAGFTWYPWASSAPTGTTVGLTLFATAPTGSFELSDVSLGSGTWTITPQFGFIQGLGGGNFLDIIGDVSFPADFTASDIDVSRDPYGQAQVFLRHQFSATTSASFGYSGTYGGKYYYNNIYTGQKSRDDQLRVFANTFVTPQIQAQGMLGTSLYTSGGFQNNLVAQLRLLVAF